MTSLLKKAWSEYVGPMVRRPERVQVAALCYRTTKKGQKEVLLITSRDTGRWILPKGWPVEGLDAAQSAMLEAWEEAGVANGNIRPEPLGDYEYLKRFAGGAKARCRTQVFPVEVEKLANDFPEADERRRKWVAPKKAAKMVDEPQLRDILRAF